MSAVVQGLLFDMPVPPKLTHDSIWRPLGPSECAACQQLCFHDASRAQVVAFLTEDCPAKTLYGPIHPPAIIYLA